MGSEARGVHRSGPVRRVRSAAQRAMLAVLVLFPAASCATRQTAESSAVDAFPRDDQEVEFMEQVESMNSVTNNDFLHSMLMLSSGIDPAQDYAERVVLARQKGWLPKTWDEPANASATAGDIAMAGCRLGGIEGGLTMHVFGPSGRYCLRELEGRGIMPTRTTGQALSGPEFRDFLNRLDQIALSKRPLFKDPSAPAAGPQTSMPLAPTPGRGGGE